MDFKINNKTIWEHAFEGNLSAVVDILQQQQQQPTRQQQPQQQQQQQQTNKICNIQDKNGNTPLVFACMGDHWDIIQTLIGKSDNNNDE